MRRHLLLCALSLLTFSTFAADNLQSSPEQQGCPTTSTLRHNQESGKVEILNEDQQTWSELTALRAEELGGEQNEAKPDTIAFGQQAAASDRRSTGQLIHLAQYYTYGYRGGYPLEYCPPPVANRVYRVPVTPYYYGYPGVAVYPRVYSRPYAVRRAYPYTLFSYRRY